METKQLRNQYLLIVAGDHEILAMAIENFRRLFMGAHRANDSAEFAALRQILDTKLPHHFAYEEAQVFPALLAEHPENKVAATIAELIQEHATLLRETERLHKLLTKRTLATCPGELWSALLDLFAALQKHTTKEDDLFRPYRASDK